MEAVRRASGGMMGASSASASSNARVAASQDQEDEESQPLLRGRSSPNREVSQQQFRQAQQEAAQNALMETGWLTWIIVILAFGVFLFWFFVNVKSWYILFVYYDAPCDQPLGDWLLVKLSLDVVSSAIQQRPRTGESPRPLTWFILGLQNAWLVLGFHWCGECRSCQGSSPELFNWVQFLVIFGTVVTLLLMLLPVLFYMSVILLVYLIGSGRLANKRAAREDTLSLLERVEYSPDLFANGSNPDDDRPSGDCCCCCEDFNADKAILRTPCAHYFHEECLAQWLKLAKTCPICRQDLDQATEDLSVKREVEDSGIMPDMENPISGARSSFAELSESVSDARRSSAVDP